MSEKRSFQVENAKDFIRAGWDPNFVKTQVEKEIQSLKDAISHWNLKPNGKKLEDGTSYEDFENVIEDCQKYIEELNVIIEKEENEEESKFKN